MTVSVEMDSKAVVDALKNVSTNLTKELGIVAWKTSKKAKSFIAKDVVSELAVPQKVVKKQIVNKRNKTSSEVDLKKSARIPIRDFKARQIGRGVSYRISKSKGRKVVSGAFQGPRPGVMKASWRGRVFKRVGKSRLPITQLFGPSPWGVFVKGNRANHVKAQINKELRKQMAERLRYRTLKTKGVI